MEVIEVIRNIFQSKMRLAKNAKLGARSCMS